MGSVLLFLAVWLVLRIVRIPYDYQHMKTFLGYESVKLKEANEEIARQRRMLAPMLPESLRSVLIALILTTDKDESVIERYVNIHTIKLFPDLTITALHIYAIAMAAYGLLCVAVGG